MGIRRTSARTASNASIRAAAAETPNTVLIAPSSVTSIAAKADGSVSTTIGSAGASLASKVGYSLIFGD